MDTSPDFERIRKIVRHEEADRVPMVEVLVDYPIQSKFLGKEVRSDDLAAQLEFWIKAGYDYIPLTVGMMSPGKVTEESAISKVIKKHMLKDVDKNDENAWNLEHAHFINDRADFERFPWDILANLDFSSIRQIREMLPPKMKVIALSGKIFTLTWMLMGFNNFATKLIIEEDLVADVFRKVAEIQFKCIDEIFKMPHVGGVWLVDDLAFGTGPMIAPEAFRKHVFPWYREIAKRCHENGLLVFQHTDGDLNLLMEDIIAIGADVLHPIDPTCMDIIKIKKEYGDRIAIAGNVANELLRSGAPVEIEERVKYLISQLAPGGGYMVCSGNSVAEWSKFENYMAMRAAAFRYGVYPISIL